MNILVLTGPTASGKTDVGIALAKALGGEILSADARQVYRGLNIGTAKPGPRHLQEARHHFIDILDPGEEYSAGLFGVQARLVVRDLLLRGTVPIVVGGSGLYIRALVDGLHAVPGAHPGLRARLEQRVDEEGLDALIGELRRVDPGTALRMRTPTVRRVVRALEVYYLSGVPLSQHQMEGKMEAPLEAVFFGLAWPRAVLYARIDSRCDEMVKGGLLEEIEMLENRGYGSGTNALNTVGYKEGMEYRRGKISFQEMIRLFRQNSRRYAKRQLTWFRKDARITWIGMGEERTPDEVAAEIVERYHRGS